jgi:glutaredoxin 2
MSYILTITDETAGGKVLNELKISLTNELTTVKEIIKARVYAEVEAYNNKMPEYFTGLVQPREAEVTLNGFKLKEKRQVDPEKQFLTALDAFQKNGYFLLIDNIQAESLDQMVVINKNTTVSFVKLTPLVGG